MLLINTISIRSLLFLVFEKTCFAKDLQLFTIAEGLSFITTLMSDEYVVLLFSYANSFPMTLLDTRGSSSATACGTIDAGEAHRCARNDDARPCSAGGMGGLISGGVRRTTTPHDTTAIKMLAARGSQCVPMPVIVDYDSNLIKKILAQPIAFIASVSRVKHNECVMWNFHHIGSREIDTEPTPTKANLKINTLNDRKLGQTGGSFSKYTSWETSVQAGKVGNSGQLVGCRWLNLGEREEGEYLK